MIDFRLFEKFYSIMADAGYFKGTSAEQDSRFANKQKKLLKQMKFPDNIDIKVNS